MTYDEDTAGGIMTTEFVAVPASLTAAQTIDRLRELEPNAETIYYVYVTDDDGRLVGVLSLRDLIVAKPNTRDLARSCTTSRWRSRPTPARRRSPRWWPATTCWPCRWWTARVISRASSPSTTPSTRCCRVRRSISIPRIFGRTSGTPER